MTSQILRKKHVHLLFFEIRIRYHSSNKIERKTNTITNQFLIFGKLYDTKSWKRLLRKNRQNSLIASKINTNTNQSILFSKFYDIKSWKRLLHSNRQNSFTASETNTNTNQSMPFRKFYDIKSWRRFMHSNCQNSPTASKTTQACFPTNIIQQKLLLRLHLDQIFPLLFSITLTNTPSRYTNLLLLYCLK